MGWSAWLAGGVESTNLVGTHTHTHSLVITHSESVWSDVVVARRLPWLDWCDQVVCKCKRALTLAGSLVEPYRRQECMLDGEASSLRVSVNALCSHGGCSSCSCQSLRGPTSA